MIDTAFIRIERAAERLGTDTDTLLLRAHEGRLQMYGLLNREVYAEYGGFFDEYEDGTPAWEPERAGFLHFTYVPLFSKSVGDLLLHGEAKLLGEPLSDADEAMRSWRSGGDGIGVAPLVVRKSALFVSSSEVESAAMEVVAGDMFESGSNSAAGAPEVAAAQSPVVERTGSTTRVKHTLLLIIAALAKEAGINVDQRGAAGRIQVLVQALGHNLGQDTIKGYLDQIGEVLESRSV